MLMRDYTRLCLVSSMCVRVCAYHTPRQVDEDEDDDYEEEEDDYYKTKPRAAPKAAGGYGRGESASIQDVLGLRPGYSIGSITKAPDDKYLLKPEDLRYVVCGVYIVCVLDGVHYNR